MKSWKSWPFAGGTKCGSCRVPIREGDTYLEVQLKRRPLLRCKFCGMGQFALADPDAPPPPPVDDGPDEIPLHREYDAPPAPDIPTEDAAAAKLAAFLTTELPPAKENPCP